MQSTIQLLLLGLAMDKLLHNLQLVFSTSLKSVRAVENITSMVLEDQFVVDVM